MGKRIPVEATTLKQAMKKAEIIREIAEVTGYNQKDVRDIIDAFTDIAQRELVTTGAFTLPGVFSALRHVRKNLKVYNQEIDKSLLYPESCFLRATIAEPVKKLHREMFRAQNNEANGTTPENWWEPYVICDGDWRKKKEA